MVFPFLNVAAIKYSNIGNVFSYLIFSMWVTNDRS